jgi:hypothetical protein
MHTIFLLVASLKMILTFTRLELDSQPDNPEIPSR